MRFSMLRVRQVNLHLHTDLARHLLSQNLKQTQTKRTVLPRARRVQAGNKLAKKKQRALIPLIPKPLEHLDQQPRTVSGTWSLAGKSSDVSLSKQQVGGRWEVLGGSCVLITSTSLLITYLEDVWAQKYICNWGYAPTPAGAGEASVKTHSRSSGHRLTPTVYGSVTTLMPPHLHPPPHPIIQCFRSHALKKGASVLRALHRSPPHCPTPPPPTPPPHRPPPHPRPCFHSRNARVWRQRDVGAAVSSKADDARPASRTGAADAPDVRLGLRDRARARPIPSLQKNSPRASACAARPWAQPLKISKLNLQVRFSRRRACGVKGAGSISPEHR